MLKLDRRDNARARCDLPVTWRRAGRTVTLRAVDFSGRGLFLLTDDEIDLHFVMDLVIELPTGSIEVLGVARHISNTSLGRGVGIALMSMTDEESTRWWEFYRAQMAKQCPPAAAPPPDRSRNVRAAR